jgi:hypothetical protein
MIMQNYIMHLANERKKYPKDTFMNAFLKLLSNALFGKTCENPENYRKTKFAIGDKQVTAMLNRLNIRNFHRIDKENDVVLAEVLPSEVQYTKPLPIDCAILDISKAYMASFYYFILKPLYGNLMKFLYKDTDSLVVELPIRFY